MVRKLLTLAYCAAAIIASIVVASCLVSACTLLKVDLPHGILGAGPGSTEVNPPASPVPAPPPPDDPIPPTAPAPPRAPVPPPEDTWMSEVLYAVGGATLMAIGGYLKSKSKGRR